MTATPGALFKEHRELAFLCTAHELHAWSKVLHVLTIRPR